jgi:hypothetical protein
MPDWLTARTLLLVAHVGAAILFIGPVTFATSAFARYAASDTLPVARALNRVSRAYGTCSVAVPVVGGVLAAQTGYLSTAWVGVSLGIFAVALVLLAAVILPGQRRLLAAAEADTVPPAATLARVRAASGLFALSWVVILVLMVAKPS